MPPQAPVVFLRINRSMAIRKSTGDMMPPCLTPSPSSSPCQVCHWLVLNTSSPDVGCRTSMKLMHNSVLQTLFDTVHLSIRRGGGLLFHMDHCIYCLLQHDLAEGVAGKSYISKITFPRLWQLQYHILALIFGHVLWSPYVVKERTWHPHRGFDASLDKLGSVVIRWLINVSTKRFCDLVYLKTLWLRFASLASSSM